MINVATAEIAAAEGLQIHDSRQVVFKEFIFSFSFDAN